MGEPVGQRRRHPAFTEPSLLISLVRQVARLGSLAIRTRRRRAGKSLARSLDGGESWASMAPIAEIGNEGDVGMPIGGYLGGLAALSVDTAFFVGGRTSLTATRTPGTCGARPGLLGPGIGELGRHLRQRERWMGDRRGVRRQLDSLANG